MPERLTIAFIGFGRMGSAIAVRLHSAGNRVRVFDIAQSARARAAEYGLGVSDSIAEVVSGAQVVFMCLPDATAVEDAVQGEHGLLRAGSLPAICVDLTSSLPSTTVRIGEALSRRGVSLLDAPVSGGVPGAREGKLTVMAGGEEAVLDAVRPVLASFASNIVWAGPLGAGHTVKALNNLLSAGSMIATAEVIAAGMVRGISADDAVGVFNAGFSRSQNSEVKYPRDILTGTFNMAFSLGLSYKDVRGACLIAEESGTPGPIMAGIRDALGSAVRELGPDADFTRMHQFVVGSSIAGDGQVFQASAGMSRAEILATMNVALLGMLMLCTAEAVATVKAIGLDLRRTLSLFSLSSGRNECTRTFIPALISGSRENIGPTIGQVSNALGGLVSWVAGVGGSLPLASLSHELWIQRGRSGGARGDVVDVLEALV